MNRVRRTAGMRTATRLVALAGMLVLGAAAQAGTINVPLGQPTIQAAIDAATAGDIIQVAAGTYRENLVWDTKNLQIIGAGSGTTTLSGDLDNNGTGDGRCLTVTNVPFGLLQGFTIADGVAPALNDFGGGVSLSNSPIAINANLFTNNTAARGGALDVVDSYATVSDNTFDTNTATMWGGAVYTTGGAPGFSGNTVINNGADYGAGFYLYYGAASLTDNEIADNVATTNGGGVYGYGYSGSLTGNNIHDNHADEGAAVRLYSSPAGFFNNVIHHNFAGLQGAGVYMMLSYAVFDRNTICDNDQGGIWDQSGNYALVKNCILMNNFNVDLVGTTATYSCIGTGNTAGTGNINTDPLFADATNGDYHLKSEYGRWNGASFVTDAVTSPCIDAGDPTWDWDQEVPPHGARVNMGAYGNTPEASKSASTPAGADTVITSPLNGATTGGTPLTVTGTAADSDGVAEVNVRANGGPWMIATGTINWTIDLPVPIGAVLIEARAQDGLGTWGPTVGINITNKDIAPVAAITAPLDGATAYDAAALIQGTASDDVGLEKVIVRVNGGAWFRATGTTNWTARAPINPGVGNLVEATARDIVGHWSPIVSITLFGAGDLRPVAMFASPVDGATVYDASVLIQGTAVDDVSLDKVIMRVNGGAWMRATGTANWSAWATVNSGPNLIEACARDSAGQFGPIVGMTINGVPNLRPATMFTSPLDGATVYDSAVRVQGTAVDDVGLGKVIARVNGGAWVRAAGTGAWSAWMNIAPGGANLLEARARDGSGQWGPMVAMTLNAPANLRPVALIALPGDGDNIADPQVTVTGTASDDGTVVKVIVRVNGGPWAQATGTTNWNRLVDVAVGPNLIEAVAYDDVGLWGPYTSVTVNRVAAAAPAALTASVLATATNAGAEVCVTLSADAAVTAEVLNIAGRLVGMIVQDRAMPAGVTTVAWNGRSQSGLAVPSGAYLVRVTARDDGGGSVTALQPLMLTR